MGNVAAYSTVQDLSGGANDADYTRMYRLPADQSGQPSPLFEVDPYPQRVRIIIPSMVTGDDDGLIVTLALTRGHADDASAPLATTTVGSGAGSVDISNLVVFEFTEQPGVHCYDVWAKITTGAGNVAFAGDSCLVLIN